MKKCVLAKVKLRRWKSVFSLSFFFLLNFVSHCFQCPQKKFYVLALMDPFSIIFNVQSKFYCSRVTVCNMFPCVTIKEQEDVRKNTSVVGILLFPNKYAYFKVVRLLAGDKKISQDVTPSFCQVHILSRKLRQRHAVRTYRAICYASLVVSCQSLSVLKDPHSHSKVLTDTPTNKPTLLGNLETFPVSCFGAHSEEVTERAYTLLLFRHPPQVLFLPAWR